MPREQHWRVVRINATSSVVLGHVSAPDEQIALERAIEEFRIGPDQRNRLLVLRAG